MPIVNYYFFKKRKEKINQTNAMNFAKFIAVTSDFQLFNDSERLIELCNDAVRIHIYKKINKYKKRRQNATKTKLSVIIINNNNLTHPVALIRKYGTIKNCT